MKRKISTLLILSLMLIYGLSLRAQYVPVLTYGFETTDNSDHWWTGNATTGTLSIINDATNAYTGTGAAKFVVDTKPVNAWDNQVGFENMPVEDSTIYRYTIRAKGTLPAGTTGTYANINITAGNYSYGGVGQSRWGCGMMDTYQKYYLMVWVGSAALLPSNGVITNVIRFPIHFGEVGTYYIDDMTYAKSSIASAEADGDSIMVDFGWGLDSTYSEFINYSSLSIMVGTTATAVNNPVIKATILKENGSMLKLKLTNVINKGDSVKISYSDKTADLLYFAGTGADASRPVGRGAFTAAVRPFKNEIVENLSTIITGMKDVKITGFKVSPNPTSGFVELTGINAVKSIEIISASGKILRKCNPKDKIISLEGLSNGLYLIKVTSKIGTEILKVIKK